MIFKRFLTWFWWSLETVPGKKMWASFIVSFVLLLGPVFALLLLTPLTPWISHPLIWCYAGFGYYGFLCIGMFLYGPKRNWRIILDKIEKKVKEMGGIPVEFHLVFEVLRDKIKKTQKPEKLKEFMSLIEQLKNRQEAVIELERELSRKSKYKEQWLDEEVARFKKDLETRMAEIPGAIEAQGMSIRTIKSCIYRLVKDD